MKTLFTLALLFAANITFAANTVKSVTSVNRNTNITANYDYTITSSTPFKNDAVLNIVNTNHAVVIINMYKPSQVVKDWLKHISINGEPAENGVNCQVKMYGAGTIIMPYAADHHPLTCYSEPNFGGTSCDSYDLHNSDGFMNTLSKSELNNEIRSFRLKRGYMVTFAVGQSGWGYSRCFIADKEDLEMGTLPAVLNGKISSYRLFRWNDAQKKGLASDTRADANAMLNSAACYDWGAGWDLGAQGIDTECVPHHIHEGWPPIADCGRVTYSPHMKTNNEPANAADDQPATVQQVLDNWEQLMRTGMRLCSPSSHDGGYGWQEQFMNAIDERGWRCDILDMHCYWDSGSFPSLINYYNKFGRPIWISEWLWGASWNRNGIFGAVSDAGSFSDSNQQTCLNGTRPILENLNSYGHVERYFYWNGENVASRLIHDGRLSKLGEYYAQMNSGIGYDKKYEFVPKVVIQKPASLHGEYTANSVKLTWSDANCDIVDEVRVEYRLATETEWTVATTLQPKDKTSRNPARYAYTLQLDQPENYCIRVVDSFNKKDYTSSTLMRSAQDMWIDDMPSNVEDYYFMFHSTEAKTNLVWAVTGNDVYYQTPAEPGTDDSQLWMLEENSMGGYTLRNKSTAAYVMCSPNSWNFITNQSGYTGAAALANYLPVYYSGGYWVMKNLGHGTYVGLWDNDKNFGAGEHLAGNRTNATGSDSGDKLKIHAIPRSAIDEEITLDNVGQWEAGGTYYLYNVDAGQFMCNGNDWNTRSSLGSNGLKWTVKAASGGLYQLTTTFNTSAPYLYVADAAGLYVDGGSSTSNTFTLDYNSETRHTIISVNPADKKYGTSAKGETHIGWDGNVSSTIVYPLQPTTDATGTHWIFMDEEAYTACRSTIAKALEARLQLRVYMQTATEYGIDVSAETTLAQDYTATAEQLATAADALLERLNSESGAPALPWATGSDYYLYNPYAGGFLHAAGSDGTQASLGSTGAKWTLLRGLGIGVYRLRHEEFADRYLFVGSTSGMYVDGATSSVSNLHIAPTDGTGMARISIDPANKKYGTEAYGETFMGWAGELANPYIMPCLKQSMHIPVGIDWMIMDETEYQACQPIVEAATDTRRAMLPYVKAAIATGTDSSLPSDGQPNLSDTATEALATYFNPQATTEQLAEALSTLQEVLFTTAPADMTFLLSEPDCTSQKGWTTQGGWGTMRATYINGDAMLGSTFLECWVSSSNTLGSRSLTQTVTLPAGTYQLSADIIATRQGQPSLKVKGVELFIGSSSVSCQSADGKPDGFTTPAFEVQPDSETELGIRLTSTNANWVATDNFRLVRTDIPVTVSTPSIRIRQEAIYDLQGRRLTTIPTRGVYIQGARKLLR